VRHARLHRAPVARALLHRVRLRNAGVAVAMTAPTPWWGLAALVAMFALPLVPAWLFEGPRIVRHHPARHICGDCLEDWTPDHRCEPVVPLHPEPPPVRVELHRPGTELERRP
jgi:hypothetical protein